MPTAIDVRASIVASPARPRGGIPYGIIEPLFALTESVIIIAAAIASDMLYQTWVNERVGDVETFVGVGLVAAITYALAAYRLGIYNIQELLQRERDYPRVVTSWLFAVLALTVTLFLFKAGSQLSRGSVVCFVVLGGTGVVLLRRAAKWHLRAALVRGAVRGRRGVLIGTKEELAYVGTRDILVRFGVDEIERVILPGIKSLDSMTDAHKAAITKALDRTRITQAEEVLVAVPWASENDLELVVEHFRVSPLPVRLLPDRAVTSVLRRQGVKFRSYTVEVQRAPLSRFEQSLKRLLDIAIASIALVVLAPVLLVTAIAIKLDSSGPVIFRQRRHGFNDQEFLIYKFRTMKVMEDGPTITQAKKQDSRVTRVGGFLRQSSIDELPQLVNVLRGEMSIAGPRPHALAHNDQYSKMIANYAFRHHMKPGITGWAQVNGYRGETTDLQMMEKRIALDLWYINNWSIWIDLQILLRTAFELLRRRNAY